MKKPRIMIGHGEGAFPEKSAMHAAKAKNAHINFNAVDLQPLERDALMRHLNFLKPSNLQIHQMEDSLEHLRAKKTNSIDHQWVHFTASAMPIIKRRTFFREVYRTLTPGGRFVVIDGAMTGIAFAAELKSAGFKVTTHRMSLEEIEKLGAQEGLKTVAQIKSLPTGFLATLPPEKLRFMQEGWVQLQLMKEENRAPSTAAFLRSIAKNFKESLSDRPCIRIIATKPRPRK